MRPDRPGSRHRMPTACPLTMRGRSERDEKELELAFVLMDEKGDGNGVLSLDEWVTEMTARTKVCPPRPRPDARIPVVSSRRR